MAPVVGADACRRLDNVGAPASAPALAAGYAFGTFAYGGNNGNGAVVRASGF